MFFSQYYSITISTALLRVKLVILLAASVCLVIYMVKIINVVDVAVSLDRITDKITDCDINFEDKSSARAGSIHYN